MGCGEGPKDQAADSQQFIYKVNSFDKCSERVREKRKKHTVARRAGRWCARFLSVYEYVANYALYLHISPRARCFVQQSHVANMCSVMKGLEVDNRG